MSRARAPGGAPLPEVPPLRVLLSAVGAAQGGWRANLAAHEEALQRAAAGACHLTVFPALSLTGPVDPAGRAGQPLVPEDEPVQAILEATYRLGVSALFGLAERRGDGGARRTQLYASQGRLLGAARQVPARPASARETALPIFRFGSLRFGVRLLGPEPAVEEPFPAAALGPRARFSCGGPPPAAERASREELLRAARREAVRGGAWIGLVTGAGREPGLAALVSPGGQLAGPEDARQTELLAELPLPVAVQPVRKAARVLVLDTDGRTILVRFADRAGHSWWAAPGGGLEPGEDHRAAAQRELAEELGRRDIELGPEIGWRTHTICFEDGRWLTQRERWYLGRCQPFPVATDRDDFLAAEGVAEVRWWSPAELARSGAVTAPRALASLAADAAAGRLGDASADLGL